MGLKIHIRSEIGLTNIIVFIVFTVWGDEENDCIEVKILPRPENIVALDCEMVGVGKSKKGSLARCSIVDYNGNVLYDQYVKPRKKVTDYRTRWSGIKPGDLDTASAVPFEVARSHVLSILSDKIVVGHALNFDMKILKMRLPKSQLRDTSQFLPLRVKADIKDNMTPSLARLAKVLLCRDIQYPTHCSVEDCIAAIDLYRSVEEEWERPQKSVYFDDSFWPDWIDAETT